MKKIIKAIFIITLTNFSLFTVNWNPSVFSQMDLVFGPKIATYYLPEDCMSFYKTPSQFLRQGWDAYLPLGARWATDLWGCRYVYRLGVGNRQARRLKGRH